MISTLVCNKNYLLQQLLWELLSHINYMCLNSICTNANTSDSGFYIATLNAPTYPFSKKYHRELYIWPKHPKTMLKGVPTDTRLMDDVLLILHC
jgi:hypothetical protein